MYLIVGLGNPEEEYARTRHNMGFDTINKLAEKYDIKINKTKFNSLYGTAVIEGKKVILLKPQTFMNLSGQAVREFLSYYKMTPEDLIVVYDDFDIKPGCIRIRKKGNPGTHNGIKSVTQELGTDDFYRIRIGIGDPEYKDDLFGFVLNHIPEDEYKVLEEGIEKGMNACITILKDDIDKAMNLYN